MNTRLTLENPDALRSIVIVGGGTAGWMSAALLARALAGTGIAITLVESAEIATVGVGEATIPPFVDMLCFLGINLSDFIQHTQATVKLAIRFDGWNGPGSSYMHPFGSFGVPIGRRPFHHAFLLDQSRGSGRRISDFNLCAALAERSEIFPLGNPAPGGARFALHVDAVLAAIYLRRYAEMLGVARLETTIKGVTSDSSGMIDALYAADGQVISADLYIDCSGFGGLLIEGALSAGYLNWRAFLPCDRALALPTMRDAELPPYTLSAAMDAGWRWRVPLQSRCGNGYVFSSDYINTDAALREFEVALDKPIAADAREFRFTPGRRRSAWVKNCVAIGLASGFLEPLESTSIHLIASGIFNLLDHFPDRRFDPALARSYNTELAQEMETIRDFLVLHYCLSHRSDTPFWREWASRAIPGTLRERIMLYRHSGIIRPAARELFTEPSWFYVFDGMGQGIERPDPLLAALPRDNLRIILAEITTDMRAAAHGAVSHSQHFRAVA